MAIAIAPILLSKGIDLLKNPAFWKTVFTLALVLGVFFGIYYIYNQHMDLKEKVLTQQVTIEQQKEDLAKKTLSIENLHFSIEEQRRTINRIAKIQTQNADALDRLRRKFAERDLGAAALQNPQQIEIEVNKMATDRIRCAELATGSAPRKDEVNEVCPQLLK